MKKINFGRRKSLDLRDKGFMMTRELGAVGELLPTKKTWSINKTALDQGQTGTCVDMAWRNFLRCKPIQTIAGIPLFAIYDYAIHHDEWTDNDNDIDRQFGTSVRAGAEAVLNMTRLKSYLWAFSLQPAVEWVLTKGSAVLGTNWYTSMMYPDSNGLVSIKPNANLAGGHAYLWRGVNTRTGMCLCSNSWSDEWGKSGEFYISFRDMERLISEDGEVCTAIEQKLTAIKVP